MKIKTKGLIAGILLLSGVFAFGQAENKAPFSRGVNFSGWFEFTGNAQLINFNKFNEQDFADVKKLGVDVIRIAIDFKDYTSSAPAYTIDPLVFKLLDIVAGWAEKYQIYVIFDNHPGNQPPTDVKVRDFLIPVWTQVAQHYKDSSQYVVYEIHNEVNHITSANWGKIQGDVIDAIRKADTRHWIVVTGADNDDGYSSVSTLTLLPKYADNKLIYTFHFYLPMLFTHQSSTNADPSLGYMARIPFPYVKNRMPPMPNKAKGTWAEKLYKDYPKDGTAEALAKKIDIVTDFIKQRNVPVFCGEFGVVRWNALQEDRVRFYKLVREALEARNIAWTMYDYVGTNGLINGLEWYGDINTELNVELAQALGFTPVPQKQRESPQTGFTVYDDYLGRGIRLGIWNETMQFNLFHTPAAEGAYAVHWKDSAKSSLQFELSNIDLSYLVQNGFFLNSRLNPKTPRH